MINDFSDFLLQYNEFTKIINEYDRTYKYILAQQKTRESSDKNLLLHELQTVENEECKQKIQLQNRVQEQLGVLRRAIGTVEQNERFLTEKRFKKYKKNYESSPLIEDSHYTRSEISRQVSEAINSIQKITKSKMPKSIAAICGFFNHGFRKDIYQQIVENKLTLEHMISVAEQDVLNVAAELQQEITNATIEKLAQLQGRNSQMAINRETETVEVLKQLKQLLLDGFEKMFCNESIYSSAHKNLSSYLSCYTTENVENLQEASQLLIGLISQNLSVSDDGTLDAVLTNIFPDGIYSDSNLLLPVSMEKYLKKPVCINYYSEYNTPLFSLFENYASQMMNLFVRDGVTTHLVDCTNMGGKYAKFTSYESVDENNRVNIIRTADELKTLLNELSDYIIETNSSYLKNMFQDVKAYNNESAIKRELHILFISNISEVLSGEMLDKLTSIVRNGSQSGVFTFLGVSTDECQTSGLISQMRVNEVNALVDLCDKVYLSSSGELSFGNSMPQFYAPPAIDNNIVQYIVRCSVQSKGALTLVPLSNNLISEENYFNSDCCEGIDIPIGVDVQGHEYVIHLDKEAAYMLIGGNPSCGKSSLIHTIILQCITRYSPEKLVLYVADLKDGSEFDLYVHKGIKSVKVVLDDAETDMATSFLNFIKANVEMRLEQFGELSQQSGEIVRNIEQYYQVNNSRHLMENIPRMLVIIDEFQSLYNSSRATGEITNWLVRMCRTVGIYIIMASQRAQGDASTVSNSFGNQTKEYFIYRAMFKLPYSGAREIMSENCSDTNRENPALRKAQTLKNGQIIINPNMGATEEDNQIVQCYYPDNETITSLCTAVVNRQGSKKGIILNSESGVKLNPEAFFANKNYVIGESNRLYHDSCNKNSDAFGDDNIISIDVVTSRQLIVCGTDHRVMGSSFWCILAKQASMFSDDFIVCILAARNTIECLQIPDSLKVHFYITYSTKDFIEKVQENRVNTHVFATILNPYMFDDLQKDDFSSASETVQKVLDWCKDENVFMLVLAESMKKVKDECSYFESEIPYRIISVGNIASIRSAMTFDAGDRLSDSPFNTVRPNVIKAYYYNKGTDKFGRFRMYPIEQLIKITNISTIKTCEKTPTADKGYSGLFGN